MTLKNASLLAFIGSALLTVLRLWTVIMDAANAARGVIAPLVTLTALLYALGSLCMTVFFWVFYKEQK